MPCNCKPACQGLCSLVKAAMFAQPAKQESVKQCNVDTSYGMIQHLERVFKEHNAADILKSGFNDTLVCYYILLFLCATVKSNSKYINYFEQSCDCCYLLTALILS